MHSLDQLDLGVRMPTADWLDLNGRRVFEDSGLTPHVAPFPPLPLMRSVSGLTSEADFAAHGVAIFDALQRASPIPLTDFKNMLDFGCGCGRLARMFKGHPGTITGCDIDQRHVEWINANLPYMRAVQTLPDKPLPFADASFDCIISISVFSHLNEASQLAYLQELARCMQPGGYLFLTVHGDRALERALNEERIFKMLQIPHRGLRRAQTDMEKGKHAFIFQSASHLTTRAYKYGIAFVPKVYIEDVWYRYFEIVDVVQGAIHDFQDIVVARMR